jgi:TRAP-type transport system periplasmic protein
MNKSSKIVFLLVVVAFMVGAFPAGGLNPAFAQKVELSLANQAAPTFIYTIISNEFKKLLEEKVGNKVTVKVYHSGQLGGEKDTIQGQQIGSVDMSIYQSSLLALWEPQMVYIDIPFLYRDVDHAIKVMNGPIGQSINKKMENHGIMVLACMNLGFRCVYNKTKPIYKPGDLAGMKYRVIQNPLYVDLVNSWGALAVPMNFPEVYTGLQQGVIEAACADPYSYNIRKHYEVAPYFSFTNHVYQSCVMSMSKKKFDSLDKDVQEAILECSKALIPVAVHISEDIDYRIIGKLTKENQVKFNTADIESFRKASQAVADKYSEKVGADIIDQIKKTK